MLLMSDKYLTLIRFVSLQRNHHFKLKELLGSYSVDNLDELIIIT